MCFNFYSWQNFRARHFLCSLFIGWHFFVPYIGYLSVCIYLLKMCVRVTFKRKAKARTCKIKSKPLLIHPPVHFEFDTIYIPCILIGEYSCLKVDLLFKREFSYYLIQIYIPCCMLVIVSWVSFWLDQGAVPARVSLGKCGSFLLLC